MQEAAQEKNDYRDQLAGGADALGIVLSDVAGSLRAFC